MPELYNGKLCVEASELISSVISKVAYDKYVMRNPMVKARNGGGQSRTALLWWDLLRKDIKGKYIQINGNPEKNKNKGVLESLIIHDQAAFEFFNEKFLLANGNKLPDDTIKEYCTNAEILNAMHTFLVGQKNVTKANANPVKGAFKICTDMVVKLDKSIYLHTLPAHIIRLKEKYNDYIKNGYISLVHRAFCNKHAEKINDDGKAWALAVWSNQIQKVTSITHLFDLYNKKAIDEGWKLLEAPETLYNYLYGEAVKPIWWGHRYGELDFKNKYTYKNTTKMPTVRDSLWYGDGTKLNYYFLDDKGNIATTNVYEVIDAYSEVLLGYAFCKSENYAAQFTAYKMAVQISGHKPYQLGFDNQGGHKKLETGGFLGKISRLAIATQPYNGSSKTIESAFGRFQMQHLKRDWFFTGQNITAKRRESRENTEFILANKANLPSFDEIKEIYKGRRADWNNAPHPKIAGKTRMEVYLNSVNPEAVKLDMWEMIDIFWYQRPQPVTITNYGIVFKEKEVTNTYMVLHQDGTPDVRWLRDNIDKKVWIKQDPDDDTYIHLYEKDSAGKLRHLAMAERKIEIFRNKQEQEDWEAGYIKAVEKDIKLMRKETRDYTDELLKQYNMHPEQHGLNSPNLKGIERSKVGRKKAGEIGTAMKKLTSLTQLEGVEAEETHYDIV